MARLFVGNLSFKLEEDEVLDDVRDAGVNARSVEIVRDRATGQSKGFGFVELAPDEDLDYAIRMLDQRPIAGRPANVSLARPKPERPR